MKTVIGFVCGVIGMILAVAAFVMGFVSGIAFGMGYVAYGVVILLGMAAMYLLLHLTIASITLSS